MFSHMVHRRYRQGNNNSPEEQIHHKLGKEFCCFLSPES